VGADTPDPLDAFESWLLRRVAQAVEPEKLLPSRPSGRSTASSGPCVDWPGEHFPQLCRLTGGRGFG